MVTHGARQTLYRAPWVVPVTAPLIRDGAVLTVGGKIMTVGSYRELQGCEAETVTLAGIITPGLVNAHCHLELSHLSQCAVCHEPQTKKTGFADWVRDLVMARAEASQDVTAVTAAARGALADFARDGVILLADTGNRLESREIAAGNPGVTVLFSLEMLGLSQAGARNALLSLESIPHGTVTTAHAPYSTSPELIKRLKARCSAQGKIFSIHVAECSEEIEFLKTGRGAIRCFLEERGVWDGSFMPPGIGPVTYLDSLGVVDEATLVIHGVHLADDEIELLARRHAKVCLCPGSNKTLGVGKPPVGKMLAAGLMPALGTDSLASNPKLSIWREMAILRQDYPHVAAETVFCMATQGGAGALGFGGRLGSIDSGKEATLLNVCCEENFQKADEVLDFLTRGMAEVTHPFITFLPIE